MSRKGKNEKVRNSFTAKRGQYNCREHLKCLAGYNGLCRPGLGLMQSKTSRLSLLVVSDLG